jgi:hypothetical protein
MVVIDIGHINIDFDSNIKNNRDLLYQTLKSNNTICNTLHVITVISNVCQFKRRYELMEQFIKRIEEFNNVKLYIVELAYEDQDFKITSESNPSHLQLRTQYALWHKENMINLGIKKLLPEDWKAVAWIDADIEFENINWVSDTLKILTKFDLVQLFTNCFDLNENEIPMSVFQSFGYKYCNGEKFNHNRGINYWHPGYAWACTRDFYEKIGGLYEKGIVGSGDYILTQSILNNIACGDKSLKKFYIDLKKYVDNISSLHCKIGFIPGNIRHFFHGSKEKRKYIERNQILLKYDYDPIKHLTYDDNGILIPTDNMTIEFLNDILQYFKERNDDEYYVLTNKILNNN